MTLVAPVGSITIRSTAKNRVPPSASPPSLSAVGGPGGLLQWARRLHVPSVSAAVSRARIGRARRAVVVLHADDELTRHEAAREERCEQDEPSSRPHRSHQNVPSTEAPPSDGTRRVLGPLAGRSTTRVERRNR